MAALQLLNSLSCQAFSWWKNCSNFMFFIVIFVFLSSWYNLFFTNKSPPLPPGPRGLPLVGNLLSLQPELPTYFTSLSREYGPIFSLRLGTKLCVVVNSPKSASEVLRDQDVVFANRDPPAVAKEIFGAKDIAWSPYGPEWRMLRKVCVREMINNDSYYLRRREIRKTIAYLYKHAGCQVNVGEQFFQAALNVMASMLWGGSIHETTKGKEIQQVVDELNYLIGAPNVSDFLPLLAPFDLQGRVKQMRSAVAKLGKLYAELIDEKVQTSGDGKDLLRVLLELKDERDGEITMDHVKALLTDMLSGGTDTTTSTIEFVMSEVMNKPQVMAKAQEELDTIVGKNNTVEQIHIHKLPYLNAMIKESLRLHPVAPMLVSHSPSQTCTISGYTIPKGACVFINVYAIHKDPTLWNNPGEFYPERFLSREMDFKENDFRYLPFGSGRRICAGMTLAERMLVFSLASLLHSFDWKTPNGERVDVSEKFGIVMKKKLPLIATPFPRLSEPLLYE